MLRQPLIFQLLFWQPDVSYMNISIGVGGLVMSSDRFYLCKSFLAVGVNLCYKAICGYLHILTERSLRNFNFFRSNFFFQ